MKAQKNTTDQQQRESMAAFTKELAKLSKKYGIALQVTGGVLIGDIKTIEYDSDHTSGDLNPRTLEWNENTEVNYTELGIQTDVKEQLKRIVKMNFYGREIDEQIARMDGQQIHNNKLREIYELGQNTTWSTHRMTNLINEL